MAIISRMRKRYIKRWYYRKVENVLRSNSHRAFLRRAIIGLCLLASMILAALVYLDS